MNTHFGFTHIMTVVILIILLGDVFSLTSYNNGNRVLFACNIVALCFLLITYVALEVEVGLHTYSVIIFSILYFIGVVFLIMLSSQVSNNDMSSQNKTKLIYTVIFQLLLLGSFLVLGTDIGKGKPTHLLSMIVIFGSLFAGLSSATYIDVVNSITDG